MENIFNQAPFECRMDWGARGVTEASERGDIIIIVDVLSFSSTVTNALHAGALIYPFPRTGDINEFGKRVDAQICLGRTEALEADTPSLSAPSFNQSHRGKKFVLSSINGATCVQAGGKSPALLIGCFLNVSSVARVAHQIKEEMNKNITVIACGERWSSPLGESRELRPSIEDYLGAGAILELLDGTKSPEARVCISAFQNSKSTLSELLTDSSSGRELHARGFPEDVTFASQWDVFQEVPFLTHDENGNAFFGEYSFIKH